MTQISDERLDDRFRRAALAECREAHRRTNDLGWLSLESLGAMEHQLRMREYQEHIEPLVRLRASMFPKYGFGFTVTAGKVGDIVQHWSEQQLRDIAKLKAMIAWHAGECGVGPKCDLPSLPELGVSP